MKINHFITLKNINTSPGCFYQLYIEQFYSQAKFSSGRASKYIRRLKTRIISLKKIRHVTHEVIFDAGYFKVRIKPIGMLNDFFIKTEAWVLCLILLVLMLLFAYLGNKAGHLWRTKYSDPGSDDEKSGFGSLEAGLFGLFGFTLAITFGMSVNRYDSNRNFIVEEANDIGTAVLRSDLYPDSIRNAFRLEFKEYLEARIDYYEAGTDLKRIYAAKDAANKIAAKLWERAMFMSKQPGMLIPSNHMVPALNAMIDITTTREVNLKARIPDIVVVSLFFLAIIVTFVAGFGSRIIRRKDWIIIFGFALLTSLIIYITLDIGRPRRGLITSALGQEAMVELRQMFQ